MYCQITGGNAESCGTDTGINNNYLKYVQALLVLYIASIGLGFVMGMMDMTHKELIIRVLKIGIVLQLTSPNSWEFFNCTFFSFFTNGVGEITGILFGQGNMATGAVSSCSGVGACIPNVAGIQAFDSAIAQLFSYDTTRKIMSLMVWKIYGFFYVIIIYLVILVILYAILKSLLIFFVCYLALCILIVLAPIFITFILFNLTKNFFDNWLKELVSYFIQPIIILTFAFFMVTLLMNQLQFMVGYRVCWKDWFNIPVLDIDFYAWQADYNNDAAAVCMATPNSIMVENASGDYSIGCVGGAGPTGSTCGSTAQVCPYPLGDAQECLPYTCFQNRYIGFPYLDPSNPSDADRISELQNGELLSIQDLIIMCMMVWFMVKFNAIVPSLAKRIAGTSHSEADAAKAGGDMAGGLGKVSAKAAYQVVKPAYRLATGGRDLKEDAVSLRKAVLLEKPGEIETGLNDLKKQKSQLMSELRKDATNPNIPLEEKTKKSNAIKKLQTQIDSQQGALNAALKGDGDKGGGSFFARSAKTGAAMTKEFEDTLPGKGLPMKIGKATIGKPLSGIKNLSNKAMNAVRGNPTTSDPSSKDPSSKDPSSKDPSTKDPSGDDA